MSPFDPELLASLELKHKKEPQKPNQHAYYSHSPVNSHPHHHTNAHQHHRPLKNQDKNQINSSNQIIKADITINLQN